MLNVEYVELYRSETLLEGAESYYLTAMKSAVEFIENLKQEDLNISKEEFEKHFNEF